MKKLIKNPLIIFALAIILIAGSSVGAASAAFVYTSKAQQVNFSTAQISVALEEGNSDGNYRELENGGELEFEKVRADVYTNAFKIGQAYEELVRVTNNSNPTTGYAEYVRVIVTKSWKNKEGNKDTTLSPELIKLAIADGWYLDTTASTPEQTVYYLKSPLNNGASKDFISAITIDNQVITKGATTRSETDADGYTTITTTYDYNGCQFNVELEVDAVQTHNAVDAIRGAWGITATTDKADDGNITSINGQSVN